MPATTPTAATDAAAALKALPTGTYRLETGASEIRFRHKTMWGLVTVKGRFTGFSGAGEIPADGSAASGSLTIDAASLDTKNAKRDEHLRHADFFEVERHPELVFRATEARPQADGTVAVTGTLTVHGVTEPLALTASVTGHSPDSVTLTAHVEIDRDRFGLGWNKGNMIKGLTSVDVTLTYKQA
ncbi:YceI family protein [Streptacidiphilus fuscans]|uniref:YceI family protein n=1 Tax=Streptacidiphilus fuscans TaxID=2789292 RepID=A0A931B4F6_9ACTN|nr:YceI family protein [Streptacidiphilus fuscans]MBF9071035.1 YceI family protein [Streptacidiphilus fuscans]